MALYIAICDDNIAQRKQTERLLNREKDARLKNSGEVLYIDSFGSSEALLKTPIKYDMFMIDVTSESQNGMDIAITLRDKGIIAPIVMISSTIKYIDIAPELSHLYHVDVPLSQNTISLMIDKAIEWSNSKPALIEIRCNNITHYVSPSDIVRADFLQGLLTKVTTVDGHVIEMTDSLVNFYKMCSIYSKYLFLGKTVINPMYVDSVKGNTIMLKDGSSVRCGLFAKKRVKSMLQMPD